MSYESLQQLASAIRDRRTIKIFEQRAVDHNIIEMPSKSLDGRQIII